MTLDHRVSSNGVADQIVSSGRTDGENKGYSVLLLDTKLNNPNHYIVLGLRRALAQNSRVAHVELATYDNVISLARARPRDLLLAVDGENASVEILTALRPLVGVMALYAFEDPYEIDNTTAFASLFDLVFTNDVGSVEAYPNGAKHLPLAASPEFDERPLRREDSDYEYDVAFVGSAWPNRVLLLRRLLSALPTLRWRIVLQYNEHLPPASLDLPESDYIGSVSHYDFVEIANRSRVNLSLHREFSGDGRLARALNPGPRMFELGLAGGFQLIDTRGTDVGSYYDPGKEIDTFETDEECIEKITLNLRSPGRRLAMAQAAKIRTNAEHLYTHRIDVILNAVSTVDQDARPRLAEGRRRLLFVTHNVLAHGNFGGVEVYQETLSRELRTQYDLYYYRASESSVRPGERQFVVTDAQNQVLSSYFTPEFDSMLTISQPEAERAFATVLRDYGFAIVHFQHLINHPVSLPIIARMMGVPSVYTSHDFYMVCTRYNLIDYRGTYCDIAHKPVSVCDNCLHHAEGKPRGAQAYRRAFISRVLASFDRILTNTRSAQAVLSGIFPELLDQTRFVSLAIPVPHSRPGVSASVHGSSLVSPDLTSSPPLRIVFLGNLTGVKGANMLFHAADALRNANILFTVCGRVDHPYLDTLHAFRLPNLTVEGGFAPGELDLTRFDMSLHIPNWPETYCITLSEAWKAGIVPVVTAIGALADRVQDGLNGFTIPPEGVGELVSLLLRVEANRRELDVIRSEIGPDLWQTPAEHCARLTTIYDEVIKEAGAGRGTPELRTVATYSVTPTIVLTGRPINSQIWANPHAPSGPPLPDPQAIYMVPLREESARAKAEIEAGCLDPFVETTSGVDTILSGRHQAPVVPGLHQLAGGVAFQVSGWFINYDGSHDQVPVLAMRTVAGDILLRPIKYLEQSARAGMIATGFTSAPISPDMLYTGVYGLELMTIRPGLLKTISVVGAILANAAGTAAGPRAFAMLPDTTRIPLFNDPWSKQLRRPFVEMVGRVDRLEVSELNSGYGTQSTTTVSMFWQLEISGWLAEIGRRTDPVAVMLRLSGSLTYYLPLEQEPRPDMMSPSSHSDGVLVGYRGKMWVHGLRPGRYDCDVMQLSRLGVTIHPLREYVLHVAPDESQSVIRAGLSSRDVLA